jgi:hypothetical protein
MNNVNEYNKEIIMINGIMQNVPICLVKKFKTNPERVKKRIELTSALNEKIKSISSEYLLSSCLKKRPYWFWWRLLTGSAAGSYQRFSV